jgi:hypothetical protein
MIWPRLAEAILAETVRAVAHKPERIVKSLPSFRAIAPDFAAVERMSDSTGMLQHSIYSVPDRRHGYCIDDNARALILVSGMPDLDPVLRDKWTTIYASFIQYAWNPDKRRFRNFMRFDRGWCEDVGSEDSNGRTLWALGMVARDAREAKHRDWAGAMFDSTASLALELGSLRAQAFAMLGAAAILDAKPGHVLSLEILTQHAASLLSLLEEARRPEWQWFEIVLAYDNARLPEALIRAGRALGRDDLVQCGLSASRRLPKDAFARWAPRASFDPMPSRCSSISSRWRLRRPSRRVSPHSRLRAIAVGWRRPSAPMAGSWG